MKKLTIDQAIAKLRETRTISTDMLGPLGIPFDGFLAFAQLSDAQAKAGIDRLLAHVDEHGTCAFAIRRGRA
jgi:hypothetical protein